MYFFLLVYENPWDGKLSDFPAIQWLITWGAASQGVSRYTFHWSNASFEGSWLQYHGSHSGVGPKLHWWLWKLLQGSRRPLVFHLCKSMFGSSSRRGHKQILRLSVGDLCLRMTTKPVVSDSLIWIRLYLHHTKSYLVVHFVFCWT